MHNREVLMLGDINIDTVWPLSEFPIPGRDGLTKLLKVEIGGAIVNSAIVLDKLGIHTGLLGCVGDDVWANLIQEKLSQSKVNLAYLQTRKDNITGVTFIIVTPDGERTMFSCRGANVQLEPDAIDEEVIKKAQLLHISGYALLESPQKDAVLQAVKFAKKHGIPVSLDTGLEPVLTDPQGLHKILNEIDICITGPQEISKLFDCSSPEEGAARLFSLGIKIAAIKLGEKGSFVATENEGFACPAFKVKTVDTTGAGDSFTAGMLYGWINKMSLRATAVLASALGAFASTVYGAGFAFPDKQDLLDFLVSVQGKFEVILRNPIDEVITSLKNE